MDNLTTNKYDSSLEKWNEELAENISAEADSRPVTLSTLLSFTFRKDPRRLGIMLARYRCAARLLPCGCESALELGCGEGFGTAVLRQYAGRVTGVDGHSESIRHARAMDFPIEFIDDNFMGKQYGAFRSVVSLDVIEHIPQELENDYMRTVVKNLLPHGTCVIGTPNITTLPIAGKKTSHVNMFNADRLRSLVSAYFDNVLLFGMNDEMLHVGLEHMSYYLIAVAFGPKHAG